MKKIIAAGIVRILEFDRPTAAQAYIANLESKKIRYRVGWQEELPGGKIRMNIVTAYNSSDLIEEV